MDLNRIDRELAPLLEVHGVELVAVEWFQGPGHGILRICIDRPGGDPRDADPEKSISIDEVTRVTRDVSTTLDALDLIEDHYTLEVGSPGPERPLQKRADFDRFAGLVARIDARGEGREKLTFSGTLVGTRDLGEGRFAVRVSVSGTEREIAHEKISRARLHEIAKPRVQKPGKGPSRRQQRLAERERARALNAAHQAERASLQKAPAGTTKQDLLGGGHTPESPQLDSNDDNRSADKSARPTR